MFVATPKQKCGRHGAATKAGVPAMGSASPLRFQSVRFSTLLAVCSAVWMITVPHASAFFSAPPPAAVNIIDDPLPARTSTASGPSQVVEPLSSSSCTTPRIDGPRYSTCSLSLSLVHPFTFSRWRLEGTARRPTALRAATCTAGM